MFMFPLGFNLNDFKTAGTGVSNFPPLGGAGGNGGPKQEMRDDESSMDNNKSTSMNLFQTLSAFTAPNPDLIQVNLEKMMVSDALEVISSLPVELSGDRSSGMDGGETEIKNESDMDLNGDEDEYLQLGDISVDTVLPDSVIPFSFKLPTLVPAYLNAHYCCETGSRLLFSSILWLRKVPVFQQLPEDLQNALIRASWAEIFVLNYVQTSSLVSFNAVMTSIVDYFKATVAQEQTPMDKLLALSDNVCLFNEFVRDADKLQLDDLSFAALRIILLFNARGVRRDYPNFAAQLDAVVEVASQELRRQLARNHQEAADEMNGHKSGPDEQFVKIVMKMSTLSKFNAAMVEELFFTNMVGQVSVDTVIPYILRLGNNHNGPVSLLRWEERRCIDEFICPLFAGSTGARTLVNSERKRIYNATLYNRHSIKDQVLTFIIQKMQYQ